MSDHVGYVVHYAGEFHGGAFVPADRATFRGSPFGDEWIHVAQAMMQRKPGATVCIEPVNEIPEWVQA